VIDQNLGGFGSELRADLRLGYLTQTSVEYYRLLSPAGWFVQPRLSGLREPVYIWANQVRTAEYFEQMAGGGLDVGRTFNRNKQASLEYRTRDVRWHLTSGLLSSGEVSGTANTAMAHYVYDSTVSGTVSPHGYRFDLAAGALFDTVDSHRAPMMQLRMGKSFTFHEKNLFGLSADVDTYFRHQVTEPLRFTLGGPYRLSASSFDEYRGTDTYLVRAGYLRRLASLPTGLGQGVYAFSAYEAGETWSPERAAFLREDVLGGVLLDTPLGVVTFGGSVGDAGRRKILLSIGKLF
jgi:NTE family protein